VALKVLEILTRGSCLRKAVRKRRLPAQPAGSSCKSQACPSFKGGARLWGLLVGVGWIARRAHRQGLPQRGYLINCVQDNVLRLAPPLIISREEIDGLIVSGTLLEEIALRL
jgi:acetylornithine/succinyldiaminopimelate/putrescine aminotransferase